MNAFIASVVASAVVLALPVAQAADNGLGALEKAARSEGQVNSVGMPDSWAN
ncbi:MAG: ABC transporter substrate-binding protein, partial [Pantoea sp.]|nr:ABC transporter substrate-binding protein [Pantoea sp.]